MTASAVNAIALESAFHEFNERSAVLENSYRDLQQQITRLTAELSASQSARHKELLEKERLGKELARTLDALPGAVVVLNVEGIVRKRNKKAMELLNQPLIGRSWAEIVKREFSSANAGEGELRLADGRILSLQRRRLGTGAGAILLLTDVTDGRRMAEMLARHQRLSAVGEMTARLAHQIRTPLASALLYASQLSAEPDSKNGVPGRIVSRLRELDRLVTDTLQFVGGAHHDDENICVAELLHDVAETGRAHCADGLRVTISLEDDALRARGNRDALKGALLNLLDNAAGASSDTGSIELGAVCESDRLCLTVTDNGPGIPPDIRTQMFEPFFTTKPQGTGLGLAVVQSVADAHDGDVLIDSTAGGTTVALCIPLQTSVNKDAQAWETACA
ncbi:MAG: PAS domain-containing sensor histidine kinase [Woeseia sp.]|nr:PAS domain-containing sensor histidine kinase [Woeseia sp.]